MDRLINFVVEMIEKENGHLGNPNLLLSQNSKINPSQNMEINTSQNSVINYMQNPRINWAQTSNWKKNQWGLFKKMNFWEYLKDDQKEKSKKFLKSIQSK